MKGLPFPMPPKEKKKPAKGKPKGKKGGKKPMPPMPY